MTTRLRKPKEKLSAFRDKASPKKALSSRKLAPLILAKAQAQKRRIKKVELRCKPKILSNK